MIQLNVSGDYITVVVNNSTQEVINKTLDNIEYNRYSDGKVSLTIGRRNFDYVDPALFEIDGEAVTDAADFVTKLNAVKGIPKVYRALLTQTGENTPVASENENLIGAISPARGEAGNFSLNSYGLFTEGKTHWYVPCQIGTFDDYISVQMIRNSVSTISFTTTTSNTNTPVDFSGFVIPVTILVYP